MSATELYSPLNALFSGV